MLWQTLQDKLAKENLETFLSGSDRPIIYIDTRQQLLSLISAQDDVQSYPVSSSQHGLGQLQDSFKTPAGIHKITQKIGDNQPEGRVFKSRIATDDISLAQDYSGKDDVITSRILWLEGLQDGYNCGAEVDTFKRYIYIHGTADEAHIGQPASIGCIRMKNKDVIKLYDNVQVDDLVIIE